MKRCPFCAEEIQDAAIVCKHCGRDLPTAAVGPPVATSAPPAIKKGPSLFVGLIVVAGVLIALNVVAGVLRQLAPSVFDQRPTGDCVLHAKAAVVPRDSPVGRAAGWSTDVLAVRNLDSEMWQNMDVTLYGFAKVGGRTSPTGAYHLATTKDLPANGLAAFELNSFEKADGARRVSLTMTVDDVVLKASVGGRSCSVEASIASTR